MNNKIPAWNKAPFVRFIIPFTTGILLQWILKPSIVTSWFLLSASLAALGYLKKLPPVVFFQNGWKKALPLSLVLLATGMLIAHYRNPAQSKQFIGNQYHQNDTLLATILEPLTIKPHSIRTTVSIQKLSNGFWQPLYGKAIVYSLPNSSLSALKQEQQFIFTKSLQPINNSGNPGGFDYKEYCRQNGVYFQVFLTSREIKIFEQSETKTSILYSIRSYLINALRNFIPGKKEAGLAEALLIGYKEDLDKDLLQSYSNTGVVHIIAISGLHVGLIYMILLMLFKPLERLKYGKIFNAIFLLGGIWMFALLTGASPSVLRSAVMFTCIIIGNKLSRQTSGYNSLFASAFILLCYNPYWLKDIGFQLSYAAVLSIMIFMQPLYNVVAVKNKLIDYLWKAITITLAAQILTAPLILFYFHQFPLLFLFTNLIAVPLSSIILVAEIVVCVAAPFPFIGHAIGFITMWLIRFMNNCITFFENIPGTSIQSIQISPVQLVSLFIMLAGLAVWWLVKYNKGLFVALIALFIFTAIGNISGYKTYYQQKLIIYNVPHHQAVDFISGHHYVFKGDDSLISNISQQQYFLGQSRSIFQVKPITSLPELYSEPPFYRFGNQNLLLINKNWQFPRKPPPQPIPVDIVILSGNPAVSVIDLIRYFSIRHLVIDNSNNSFKTAQWIRESAQQTINCFPVAQQGAFVLNLY